MIKAVVIHTVLLLAVLGVSVETRAADENTIQVWADQFLKHSNGSASPIQVTSKLRFEDGNPLISFQLVNLSGRTLEIQPFDLPWGNTHAVSLLVIRSDKTFVKLVYPIDDPTFESWTKIAPGATLTGEYNLGWRLGLSESDRKKDIVVLWSYFHDFGGTSSSKALATGAVVIPRIR